MISGSFLLTYLGFWLFYQTSSRIQLPLADRWTAIFRAHHSSTHLLGALCLLLALAGSIMVLGIGSGIFAFILFLSTVGSIIVMLSPLRMLKADRIALVFIVLFIFEILA